jgi:PAS domain S-box-containing protein
MQTHPHAVRLLSLLAFLILFITATILPVGYFLTAYGALSGAAATEAEINARLITAIVNANPAMWEFEQLRMEEYLSRRSAGKDPEARRVYNLEGGQVASNADAMPPPTITRSAHLYDSGVVVGRLDITRSLLPVLARTALLALVTIALACAAYVVLRASPIRLIAEKENRLRVSEEKYRNLIESSSDGIIVFDKSEDVILEANQSALTMLATTRELAVGMSHSAICPPLEAETYRKLVVHSSDDATTQLDGIGLWNAQGERIEVEVSANVAEFGGRRVVQCRFKDVTDRKQVEKRLARAERMAALGILTAGIAHQFNNINAAALGYLQLLQAEPGVSSSSRRYISAARTAIDRAVAITSQLQVLSTPATAALPPPLAGDVVREALPSLLPDIEREAVALAVDLRDTRPVQVARAQLDFVVRALIVNARHALMDMPRRELRVETSDRGEWTCIRVQDTGIGIAASKRNSLFTPFFSEKGEHAPPGSPQAKVKGVGLSLAVAHSIVSGCGGRIEVETDAGSGAALCGFRHEWQRREAHAELAPDSLEWVVRNRESPRGGAVAAQDRHERRVP